MTFLRSLIALSGLEWPSDARSGVLVNCKSPTKHTCSFSLNVGNKSMQRFLVLIGNWPPEQRGGGGEGGESPQIPMAMPLLASIVLNYGLWR